MRHLLLATLLFLLPASAMAAAQVGQPAPKFDTEDVFGAPVKFSAFKDHIVVLEWNNPGCPFVHKHYDSDNMQKLQFEATQKDVIWLTLNSSAKGKEGNLDISQARDYINNYRLSSSHYILDPEGKIGKLYGAKTTPHMFVIDKKGNIAYMGAIDDKADPDPASIKSAKNYVREAINSLLAKKPIAVPSTQSYGCSVKYAD